MQPASVNLCRPAYVDETSTRGIVSIPIDSLAAVGNLLSTVALGLWAREASSSVWPRANAVFVKQHRIRRKDACVGYSFRWDVSASQFFTSSPACSVRDGRLCLMEALWPFFNC
jgi:hypothetical protein